MRHLGAVVILALVPSVVAGGQTAPRREPKTQNVTPAFAALRQEEWTTAVRTHAAGKVDQPLKTVASWPAEHVRMVVQRVFERLHRLLEARDVVATQELAELTATLGRALSLHTDIAIAEREALVRGSPADARAAVILVDGRETAYIGRSYHWAIARQIGAGLAPLPGERPRVVAWYRAISAALQEWGDYDVVGVHLEAGLRLFRDDPMLALYQGTFHQMLGDARLQQHVRERRHVLSTAPKRPQAPEDRQAERPPPSDLRRVPKASKAELEAAEREFRLALSLDPTLHEARIRLAHVLSTLGDDRAAADTVRPALQAPLPPFLEFYAAMILGRSEEQLGRFTEAGVAYTRAATRFPGAQSAEIGRSRVALAQGRAPDAVKILVDVVGPYSTEQADPWLGYLKQHDPDSETLLEAWRAGLK